jgi:cell division initiation protein
MKLTPLDIRHKEFKRGMRGYTDVEVDEFLDQVADEFERLFKENIDLQERLEALEDKVAGYRRIEETLQKTLINAQANAEEQKQNANKQAQLVLQDAELKARQLVNEAYSERQAIEQSMAKLRSAEEDFRFKFRQLLDGYLRQLQDSPQAGETPPAADLSRHAEAIKEAIARESAPEPPEGSPQAAAPATEARPADRGAAGVERDLRVPVADDQPDPSPARPAAPSTPVVPARGRGGVQAGVPRVADTESAPEPSDDPEITAATPAPGRGPDKQEDSRARSERVIFGESDDLLADVDTGVNENEFKW